MLAPCALLFLLSLFTEAGANHAGFRGSHNLSVTNSSSNHNLQPDHFSDLVFSNESDTIFVANETITRNLMTAETSGTYGGRGGNYFGRWNPRTGSRIQINGGKFVDAIVLDGVRYGGRGGRVSHVMTLREGEYINSFEVRSGKYVDRIVFSTNMGQTVGGGGTGGVKSEQEQIEVTGIAGRRGKFVDQIIIFWKPLKNSLKTMTFGGSGGVNFNNVGVHKLGLKTGKVVDNLFINGVGHGGRGGAPLQEMTLQAGEYVSTFSVRSGRFIDSLRFASNRGQVVSGGGSGGRLRTFHNIRLVSIAGRSGKFLDQIRVTFLDNYHPSSVESGTVTIFLGARGEGRYEEVTSESYTRTESILKTSSFAIEASVEAEFFSIVNTNLKTSFSSKQEVQRELSQQRETSSKTEFVVEDGEALIELTQGNIMQTEDGTSWVAPTAASARYDKLDPNGLSSFLSNGKKVVDLAGYILTITGHENVAKLDPNYADAPFDVYVAK